MNILVKSTFLLLLSLVYINASVVGASKGDFSVNQGNANYNLEIVTPKGVAGLKPSLNIVYNSSNNFNGILGKGFSLNGVSQISKCKQTLFSEKINDSRIYNYCIDGQKIVLKDNTDTYGSNTEYATDIDSYSKIIKENESWTVYTKDGLIYSYGKTEDSTDSGVFYRVNKIEDRYANSINFRYDPVLKSLNQITYANNIIDFTYEDREDKKTLYSIGVPFQLNKRLKTISIKTDNIETSSYIINYEYINHQSKINNIKECIDGNCLEPIYFYGKNNYIDDSITEYTLPESDNYILQKNTTGIKTMLLDMNGDGLVDKLKVSSSKLYVALNNKIGFDPFKEWEDSNPNFSNDYVSLEDNSYIKRTLLDVNGDGLPDKVYSSTIIMNGFTTTAYMKAQLNTSKGFQSDIIDLFGSSYQRSVSSGLENFSPIRAMSSNNILNDTFDFNNDGYVDTVYLANKSVNHFKMRFYDKKNDITIGLTDNTKNYEYIQAGDGTGISRKFIDMNGDGLPDRVINYNYLTNKKGLHVALNSKNGMSDFVLWDDREESEQSFYILKKDSSGTYSQLMDINGDGLPDRVQHKNYKTGEKGLWVSLNTGNGFEAFENWFREFSFSDEKDYYLTKESISGTTTHIYKTFADLDSDGLIDIIFGEDVYFNVGEKFIKKSNFFKDSNSYITKSTENGIEATLLDINGDGYLEKVEANGTSLKAYKGDYDTKFDIDNITNLKDQDISITFSDLRDGDIYSSDEELSYPSRTIKAFPMKVVKSFTTLNGVGSKNRTNLKYENYAINLERGSLGFKTVITEEESSNAKSEITYYQNYPYIGNITENKKYVNNKLISKVLSYYSQRKSYERSSSASILQVYPFRTIESNYDYDSGVLLTSKTTINISVSIFGDIVEKKIKTTGNSKTFTKKIVNKYAYNNYTSWLLGRLSESTVIHKAYGKENIIKNSSFKYDPSTGTLTEETIEPSNEKSVTKTYTYTTDGNKKTETITASDIEPRKTTYFYDSNGINITSVENALGHTGTKKYTIRNQLESVTGPNGLKTTFLYDEMGRKIKQTNPDGTYTTWEYAWIDNGHKVTQKLNGKFPVTVYYDILGREIKKEKKGFDGRTIIEEFTYDNKGNKVKVSIPYFENSETPSYIYYIYDDVNRLKEVDSPASHNQRAIDTIEYKPFKTIRTNAKGQTKTTTVNALGKVIEVNDNGESIISYEYDSIGNLKKTIDSKDNEIIIDYDIFGNKIKQNDPNMDIWTYTYFSTGELKSQIDAKVQATSFIYDKLGRVINKITPEGTIEFIYDTASGKGIGKIHKEIGIGIQKEYVYDEIGRVSKIITTLDDNQTYTKQFMYDSLGRVLKTIEPNNVEIKNYYNENGYLSAVTTPRKNAGEVDTDRLKMEISHDMNQYLLYKQTALKYSSQLVKYNKDLARYKEIISLYKDNPNTAQKISELINHVTELEDLIYALEALVNSYDEKAKEFYPTNFKAILDASNSTELASLYETFKADLINMTEYSLSILEELNIKQKENKKLLYCGNIGGVIVFCPDNMSHDNVSNYTAEENILFYGTNKQILDFYEKALVDLTSDVNYIKDIEKKIAYFNYISNNYNNKSDAYQEMIDSSEIYFYKVIEQNSLGITTSYLSGNGLETKKEYDQRGILYGIKTGYEGNDEYVRESTYEYDLLNNVTNRNDVKLNVEQDFLYDSLNRLRYTNITTKDSTSTLEYRYDEIGNMTYKSDLGYYDYNSSRPHAVTKIGEKTFEYDANGNMINNDGKIITYSSFNKPVEIKTDTSTVKFSYDAKNSRYKKTSNSNTTHYINKTFERHFINGVVEDKYLIHVGGQLVSVFSKKGGEYSVKFLHYDNLGSIDTITNNLGEVVERFSYKPFGERLKLDKYGNEVKEETKSNVINRGFTGHEHIEEAGLIHMNGRVYDPTIARFLSADPNIQDSKDSQSYNRYTYVKNNPLKYTDPSGFFFKKLFKKIKKWIKPIIAIAVGVLSAGLAVAAYMSIALNTAFSLSAGLIAVTSGVVGSIGFGAVIAAGAAMGFASTLVMTGSVSAAAKGAVFGAIGAGVAYGIGHGSMLESLRNVGNGTGRLLMHGMSRAAISKAQGGRWSSGFWSAVISAGTGSFRDVITKGNYYANVAFSSIVGGTASEISGGKFANGAVTGAFVYMFNDALEDRAKKAYSNGEKYAYNDRAGNFPPESYKCNKFVADMANDVDYTVKLNIDSNGNLWPPTAGKWGWGDPNADIPGWKIVTDPKPGDVVGQVRDYSDATGHVGILVDGGYVISARNNGVSMDPFDDVFPSKYNKPVVYRRYIK